MKYKTFEIKIINSQGVGSFGSPLCNTPFGYEIHSRERLIDKYYKMSSSEEYAIESAKRAIDRYLERGEL